VKAYLTICAVYRNEAPYLREWIEFHRLVGVERFYLYNNRSTDDHLEVLQPYVDAGIVVWEDFPEFPPQLRVFEACLATHRDDARWIAFIDCDEFLFSPTERSVSEILPEFEQHSAVGVNCLVFGTSGHQTPQPGLVIENYRRRLGLDRPRSRVVKCIVDPTAVIAVGFNPHYFRYGSRGLAVDERHRPYRGESTESLSVDLLRINHYFTRSQEERERKLAAPRADAGLMKNPEGVEERDRKLNEEPDETILTFAPALRAALGLEAIAGS
jgi:hypothetical protein